MISFQKKKPKSVFDSVAPILFLSRLAGVCTLVKKGRDEDGLKRSNILVTVQIIVLFISMGHLGFIPYAVINIEQIPDISLHLNITVNQSGNLSSQKFITKMANIVLISSTSILVKCSNLIQMPKHLPDLLKDIQRFDRIIPQKDNRDFKRILFLSGILVIVSWPYQVYSILLVSSDSWMAFLMFYLHLYNNFSIISCEFQFITLCGIIESRFDQLNEHLKDLSRKNYLDNEEASLAKLSISKKSWKLMTDAFVKLNNLHGFQLLIILSGLALNVLFGLYFSIFGGYTSNSYKTSITFQRISGLANELLWSLYYLIRFIVVCVAAEILTCKANTSKKVITEILEKTTVEAVNHQLWIYLSWSVINKMYITACGFFKINKALITSAVSMGTTYLVILAQFQKK